MIPRCHMVSNFHNLEDGGENMSEMSYNQIRASLSEFSNTDIADFCVHYLREHIRRDAKISRTYIAMTHDLQAVVDAIAVNIEKSKTTWE